VCLFTFLPQVKTSYMGTSPRIMKVKALAASSARDYRFRGSSGSSVTVQQYFRSTYNVSLKHPDWPCVMISKTAAIPLELCRWVD